MTTTLLAVDDSVTMRKVLEITFSGENYKPVLASSAAEAVKLATSERPAMALIDHTLPEMSGYDLARDLKAKVPNLAVIILSSKQNPYDKARGSASGVDDFMDNPFDTQKLLDKVAQVLAQPRAAAAAPAAAPPAPVQRPATPAAPVARPAPVGPMAAAPSVAHRAPGPAASVGARPAVPHGPGPGAPVAPMPPAAAMAPRSPNAPTLATPKPTVASSAAAPPKPVAAAHAPAPSIAAAVAAAGVSGGNGQLTGKLEALGLTKAQVDAVLALSHEIVEKVVWEVVPVLAETMIKEEIRRLTSG